VAVVAHVAGVAAVDLRVVRFRQIVVAVAVVRAEVVAELVGGEVGVAEGGASEFDVRFAEARRAGAPLRSCRTDGPAGRGGRAMETNRATSGFRVIAMSERLADRVRQTRSSPGYGHPVHAETADGPWPCRVCLTRKAEPPAGERRLLFTYDPFHRIEELPLPGPVFIHEERCERHREDAGFPEDLRRVPLTLNAYGRGRQLRAQAYVDDGAVEPTIEALLARPDVDYLHLRHKSAGCYLARIERAASATTSPI
jgi:hypothetical protein